jgi:hypothetical protein
MNMPMDKESLRSKIRTILITYAAAVKNLEYNKDNWTLTDLIDKNEVEIMNHIKRYLGDRNAILEFEFECCAQALAKRNKRFQLTDIDIESDLLHLKNKWEFNHNIILQTLLDQLGRLSRQTTLLTFRYQLCYLCKNNDDACLPDAPDGECLIHTIGLRNHGTA